VAIFDDRLEITSPGGLMPGVTIDRMKEGYSQIRNRALAHAFSYMNLIEGWGTGIPRLIREMKEYGLAEPEFVDMEIALRINLYRVLTDTETGGETDTNTKSSVEINTETGKEKSSRNEILAEIKRNPVITQKQLAEKVGLSYSGIRYAMRQL
jgi:predicted HTH transcriptional regulator